MTRRLAQILFIALAAIVVTCAVAAVCFYFYGERLEIADVFVYGTTTVLLVFLGLLVLRCVVLTTISLIEHIRHAAEPVVPADYPSYSVIIPAYNEGPVIESSIAAAMSLDYPNFEVLVVDDGSTDDTFQKATALSARYGAHRLRVFSKANSGKGSALNAGIRYARGTLVLCTDADSRLDRGVLHDGRRRAFHMQDHPGACAFDHEEGKAEPLRVIRHRYSQRFAFGAPADCPDMARTVFLHSKGYYDILRNPGGTPDLSYLQRFKRPGEMVRFANDRLKAINEETKYKGN